MAEDLNREDVHVVIGRLSDFGFNEGSYPDWELVREAQVEVAEDALKGAWVDTDDLNDGQDRKGRMIKNDLQDGNFSQK